MSVPAGIVIDYLAAEHASLLEHGSELYAAKVRECEAQLIDYALKHHGGRFEWNGVTVTVETVKFGDSIGGRYLTFRGEIADALDFARVWADTRFPIKWHRRPDISEGLR